MHACLLGMYLEEELLGPGVCRCWAESTLPLLGGCASFPVNIFSHVFCPLSPSPLPSKHILGSSYTKFVTILSTHDSFSYPCTSAPANPYHDVLITLYYTLN